ncbi:MAG: hypothetical protein IMF12_10320, partial [Proteobacteria bacterium]|nr:hypothetical protein [Pseudomonadota bacterium]
MQNLKLRTKLLLTAMAIGFIPLLLIGGFSLFESRYALSNQAFSQLESIREIKKNQLEGFFAERKNDMQVLLNIVDNLHQNSLQKLQAIQQHKSSQINEYFRERLNNLRVLAKNDEIRQVIKQIDTAIKSNDQQAKQDARQKMQENFGDELEQYHNTYGFDD